MMSIGGDFPFISFADGSGYFFNTDMKFKGEKRSDGNKTKRVTDKATL